jgi:fatty-acyl-CoA synthase
VFDREAQLFLAQVQEMKEKSDFHDSGLVWARWERHAKERPQAEAIIHWDALAEPFRWTYQALLDEALKVAHHLLGQGVKPGDVCALIMRHNKDFYPFYMGIEAMGAIPAVLAYPNARLHPDKFLHGLEGMARKSGLDWVLTERDLEKTVAPLILGGHSSVKGIFFPLEWEREDAKLTADLDRIGKSRSETNSAMPCLLQHSSGTTGLQKAVILSHRAVLDHVERYGEAIGLNARDKVISWLPLYHDMGLIAAFHMPLAFGIPSIQMDAFQWLSAPALFFQAISRERATLTWLPNFSYNFMADRVFDDDMEGVDASCLRLLVNCSEVVRPDSHEKFFTRFSKYGIRKDFLTASYAMAETTFAVTQTPLGSGAVVLDVDRGALAEGIVQPVKSESSKKSCMSSGKTIRDCSVNILDEKGVALPEDRVGPIAIRSVSLFGGYRNDPQKTSQVFQDGWYVTSDRGFLHNGEYYILGRGDDVIVFAGRNIFPEDIEDVVNKVKGVIPGRLVAFGMDDPKTGTQDVCVVVETTLEKKDETDGLILAIKQAAMGIDVTLARVYLVPPRSLIKSSSGKISRKMNRERIVSANMISKEAS